MAEQHHSACPAAARPQLLGSASAPGPGAEQGGMASLVPAAASSPAGAASRSKKRPASPGTGGGAAKKKKATAPGGSQVMVRGGRSARMRDSEPIFPALSRRAGSVSHSSRPPGFSPFLVPASVPGRTASSCPPPPLPSRPWLLWSCRARCGVPRADGVPRGRDADCRAFLHPAVAWGLCPLPSCALVLPPSSAECAAG